MVALRRDVFRRVAYVPGFCVPLTCGQGSYVPLTYGGWSSCEQSTSYRSTCVLLPCGWSSYGLSPCRPCVLLPYGWSSCGLSPCRPCVLLPYGWSSCELSPYQPLRAAVLRVVFLRAVALPPLRAAALRVFLRVPVLLRAPVDLRAVLLRVPVDFLAPVDERFRPVVFFTAKAHTSVSCDRREPFSSIPVSYRMRGEQRHIHVYLGTFCALCASTF